MTRRRTYAVIALVIMVVDWNLSVGPLTLQATWRCTATFTPTPNQFDHCYGKKIRGELTLSGGTVFT